MNPMTNVKNIKKLSELELKRGNFKSSWHDQYKDSAWLFVGGLPYDLTEGDVICVFSQYGEIVNINLVRDKSTGKSKGFCFLCYEDQRSSVLAVDNFNGIKLLGRTIRVDHVSDYKAPKDSDKLDDETRKLHAEGCAPKHVAETEKEAEVVILKTIKKEKKEKMKPKVKKEKKRKKKKKKASKVTSSSSSDTESESDTGDDSDSNSKKSKRNKGKHSSKKHKKKFHESESESASEEEVVVKESAKTKRQQLEEKIRVLEQALNSVKNASRRNQLNSNDQASDSKTKSAATREEFHDRERPSINVEYRNETKHRAENESQDRRRDYNSHSGSDHHDRNSNRNNGYRNRESGARKSDDVNGTREKEWSRERDRYDERSRDRDHADRDRHRDRENRDYDRDRSKHRDRSHDRHRR